MGTHPLFFLFSRFLLKSYIRKICNIYAVAYCIFQLPLYSSPYNFIYTSLAIVAAAGDIAHETDNIDKQVKTNRLHTKQYSDPKHQYSRKKWTLFDEKKVRMTKLKPLRNDCRFFMSCCFKKSNADDHPRRQTHPALCQAGHNASAYLSPNYSLKAAWNDQGAYKSAEEALME